MDTVYVIRNSRWRSRATGIAKCIHGGQHCFDLIGDVLMSRVVLDFVAQLGGGSVGHDSVSVEFCRGSDDRTYWFVFWKCISCHGGGVKIV